MANDSKRWSGGVTVTISMPIEEAWKDLGDFCTTEKYLEVSEVSFEGEKNCLHCIRYVKAASGESNWAREELIALDNSQHYLKYRILETGMGFSNYEASVKLNDAGEGKTTVSWYLDMDPIHNVSEEDVINRMSKVFTSGIKMVERNYHQRMVPITSGI